MTAVPQAVHDAADAWAREHGCQNIIACNQTPLAAFEAGMAAEREQLSAAIECVLLDHDDQLSGENVDANLSELAYVYEQLTGWTVERELSTALLSKRQTED